MARFLYVFFGFLNHVVGNIAADKQTASIGIRNYFLAASGSQV